MVPGRSSPAACMAAPRSPTRRRASPNSMDPQATRAEYSPSECPSAMSPARPWSRATRQHAVLMVRIAGWHTSVRTRSSSGPSKMILVMSYPRASLASAKVSPATGKASHNSLPMPTCWAPCPGKSSAIMPAAPSAPVPRPT